MVDSHGDGPFFYHGIFVVSTDGGDRLADDFVGRSKPLPYRLMKIVWYRRTDWVRLAVVFCGSVPPPVSSSSGVAPRDSSRPSKMTAWGDAAKDLGRNGFGVRWLYGSSICEANMAARPLPVNENCLVSTDGWERLADDFVGRSKPLPYLSMENCLVPTDRWERLAVVLDRRDALSDGFAGRFVQYSHGDSDLP